jgi:hypothetical protein
MEEATGTGVLGTVLGGTYTVEMHVVYALCAYSEVRTSSLQNPVRNTRVIFDSKSAPGTVVYCDVMNMSHVCY